MTFDPILPRIYTSFAEFEREERARLGLPPLPEPVVESAALPEAVASEPLPVERVALSEPGASAAHALAIASAPPALVLQEEAPPPKRRGRSTTAHTSITPASLRAEGVLEIGCAPGTSVLYVRTRAKLHLFHVTWLPDRQLDDYAVSLAVNWIEGHGLPGYVVADNLGVNENTLRKALLAAGYERAIVPPKTEALSSKRGNRRGGRFMRRESTHAVS